MRGTSDILTAVAAVVLSAALFVAVISPMSGPVGTGPAGLWQQWGRLDLAEKREFVLEYEVFRVSPEGVRLLTLGRNFAEFPEARKARLRELHQALLRLQAGLSELERRELRAYDTRTRAVVLFDRLAREEPGQLEALRREFSLPTPPESRGVPRPG